MRKKIFTFPPIYPVLLSLVCWAVALVCLFGTTCQSCAQDQALYRVDGVSNHTMLLHRPPLWTHHFCGTWSLAFILCALEKPNTLQVQQVLWVLVWFFKRAPKPQVIEKAEKQRMRRPCKERKKERRNKKTQGQRRGREARQQALWRGRGRRLPPEAECSGRPGLCAQASACVTQLPILSARYCTQRRHPLLTKSGHPVECLNRFMPLKLCFSDIMKVK